MNKTKIIATIGPSSSDINIIEKLILNGTDTFRINLEYATKDFCIDIKNKLDIVNNKLNTNVALMFDTIGSNIRIGRLHSGEVILKENTKIRIYNNDILGDCTKLSINYDNLIEEINYDTIIKIYNGNIELKVLDKGKDYLLCLVIKGGLIKEKTNVNILDLHLNLPFLSNKDKEDIILANKLNVDYLVLSHVENHDNILEVNDLLIDLSNDHINIVTKIENDRAYENIDDILNVSDGIMVDRKSLSIELPMERVPGIQKAIISKCQKCGKFSIVSTDMIASSENNNEPTRAEVSDVANAVLDGTDSVMLSTETAVGKNPIETIINMEKILEQAELDIDYSDFMDKAFRTENRDTTGLIAHSVTDAALYLKCKAIFTPTVSGYTARKISRFRPICPIIAASPNVETVKSLQLYFGVYPITIDDIKTLDKIIEVSKKHVEDKINLNSKDKFIITGGYPFREVKYTNFMKIEEI